MATSPDNLTLYRYKRTNKGYTEDLGDGATLTLMLIPAGEFMMGAPEDEPDSNDAEHPQHRVELSQFFMGRYPVTQAQWRAVASYGREDMVLDPDPSNFKGDDLPVEQVNWYEATEFCKRLSTLTGKNYHLPSEAQWEYACRAETETAYHFGDQITTDLANYSGKAVVTVDNQVVTVDNQVVTVDGTIGQRTPVGQYPANQWGLHDMHGNVFEWCQDHPHDNYKGAPTDDNAWIEGGDAERRILRGGSRIGAPWDCRSAYRGGIGPGPRDNGLGFRVCCSAPRALQ